MASSVLNQTTVVLQNGLQDVLKTLYHDLKDKLNQGTEEPVVSFAIASVLGFEGIAALKEKLELAFGVLMEVDVDLVANTLKVLPIMPPADDIPAGEDLDGMKAHEQKKRSKVPRPPNAFILYRKEWHPRIVAANPGLHNNRISVLLGEKWRSEHQAVRDEYKLKAAMAKEEHAVLHPNYTYKPRKPSEKKKRMTKTKLAKLAAIAQSHLPTIDLAECPGHASIRADADYASTLLAQLERAKAAYPCRVPAFVAHSLINMSDDIILEDAAHFSFDFPVTKSCNSNASWTDMMDVLATDQPQFFYSSDSTLPGPDHRGGNASIINKTDHCAEIERQVSLQAEMNALFDFEGATASLPSTVDYTCELDEFNEASTEFMLGEAHANGFTV